MASKYILREELIVAMYRVLNEDPSAVMDPQACETALSLAGFTDDHIDQHADAARDRVRMIHHHLTLARAG